MKPKAYHHIPYTAWQFLQQRSITEFKMRLERAVNDHCTCGGSGPGETNCDACNIWHEVMGTKEE